MRWIAKTFAVFTVVSWLVMAGLFARPVVTPAPTGRPTVPARRLGADTPANWQQNVLASSRDFFPGVSPEQTARVVPIVERYAKRYQLDPLMVLAVIQVESRFDATAVSSQRAMGLMQLQPETARELAMSLGLAWTGDEQLFDPEINVLLGCAYLRRLSERFGDVDAALAAYSSGPGMVEARLDANGRLPLAYTDRVWDVLTTLRSKTAA
jgi:soluble lytic murein transglycosylase-like protein